MNPCKYLAIALLVLLSACSKDLDLEPAQYLPGESMGEIRCHIQGDDSRQTRTYYSADANGIVYNANWDKEDCIDVCFDNGTDARKFKLHSGESSQYAIFYGPVPDTYSELLAVYPSGIFMSRNSSNVEIMLPETIGHSTEKLMDKAMPMVAKGKSGILNFYNLMGVIKLGIRGNGLLSNITVSSPDGHALSGRSRISYDASNLPILNMEERGSVLNIVCGKILLAKDPIDIFIPIPAGTYENGLKFTFTFEGKTETRSLNGPLTFERSVLRGMKPYDINCPFDFSSYVAKDNEIWYKSLKFQDIEREKSLDASVFNTSYSDEEHLGVITTDDAIHIIEKPLFSSPEELTYLKLPTTVQEVGDYCFRGAGIESFEAPADLKQIGIGAFTGNSNMKKLVLNDGLQSIAADAFGDCSNLESVYIPESVKNISGYAFRRATAKLDHWDGNCSLIDADRHTLFSNSAYGMEFDPIMIEAIAGCNLTEYSIPENALCSQNYAFCGMKKLKKLIVHKDYRSFGAEFFTSLKSLEIIICHAEEPPSLNYEYERFESKSLKEIRVPEHCVEQYKKAYGWENFADIIKPL